jgi:hypothetical protein
MFPIIMLWRPGGSTETPMAQVISLDGPAARQVLQQIALEDRFQ